MTQNTIADEEQKIVRAAASEALLDAGAIDEAVVDLLLAHDGVSARIKVQDGHVVGVVDTVSLFKAARPALFGPVDPTRLAGQQLAAAQTEYAADLKRAKNDAEHSEATNKFLRAQKSAARTAKGPHVLKFTPGESADSIEKKERNYSQWLRDN
jgi:hypothetical protein